MKTPFFLTPLALGAALLLAGCSPDLKVGALQTESQSGALGDAESVRVEVDFAAGDLELAGGTEGLLEADFTYNVARLEPEVKYTNGTLAVRQPKADGLPLWRDFTDFRNEWNLRLYDAVPIELRVEVGAATSDLQLGGLALTRLDVVQGAGVSTIDLSGAWARELGVTIDTGATDITVRLPSDVGARVEVSAGASAVRAAGLTRQGEAYTNAAYGESAVTLRIQVQAGSGQIRLEVDQAAAATD